MTTNTNTMNVFYGDYSFQIPSQSKIELLAELFDEANKGSFEPMPIDGIDYKAVKVKHAPIDLGDVQPIQLNISLINELKARKSEV